IVARIPRVNLIIDASGHLCSPLPFVRTTCPSEEEFIELPSAHQSLGPQIERDEDQKAQSELGKSTDLPDTEESEAEAILERLEEPHEHCDDQDTHDRAGCAVQAPDQYHRHERNSYIQVE